MTEPNGKTGFTGGQMALAVLGGAAAGAAIALLTAPRSGKETRAKISETVREKREQLTDFVNDGKEKARHLPGAVKVAGTAARNAFVDAMDV